MMRPKRSLMRSHGGFCEPDRIFCGSVRNNADPHDDDASRYGQDRAYDSSAIAHWKSPSPFAMFMLLMVPLLIYWIALTMFLAAVFVLGMVFQLISWAGRAWCGEPLFYD